jgi:hypothetical protein
MRRLLSKEVAKDTSPHGWVGVLIGSIVRVRLTSWGAVGNMALEIDSCEFKFQLYQSCWGK